MTELVSPRVILRFVSAGVLIGSLAACGGILSGAGPYMGTVMDTAKEPSAPYALVDLSAENITPYMLPAEPPRSSTVSSTQIPEVRLVPGDVLKIMIADSVQEGAIFAPLAAGGSTFDSRVDANGKISLPYIGRPTVANLTLSQVEDLIRKELKGTAREAQVLVSLVGDLSGSVLVAGAVKQPGRFSALQGPLTLLDAINMAGGPILEPHLVKVTVRNGTESNSYSYQDLLAGENMMIAPHSEIILERARKRFVAMGAVGSPGLHDLPSQNSSLLEALGAVGGLKEGSANPQGVFVFRLAEPKGDGKPRAKVFRLNMRNPEAIFLAREFLVHPDDAIYVTNAAVYEWQKIIAPIVQVLVLGRAVNGF